MEQSSRRKLIAIVGPTASGKSALAIRLAERFGGEVVSADSRQVYKGLNLGTGKATGEEMRGVPHHLLDIEDPRATYTAARFAEDAADAIRGISGRKRLPIICGGTGFYVDVLLGQKTVREIPPDPALRARLGERSAAELYTMLGFMDKERAASIDPNNRHRLIRAIEIAKHSDGSTPPSASAQRARYDVLWIGIEVPRETLKKRIRDRLESRIREGMLDEARGLLSNGLSLARMRALGLEYRAMADHLAGAVSAQKMQEVLETEISRYAKRQMTWFRRNKDIHWIGAEDSRAAEMLVEKFLGRSDARPAAMRKRKPAASR